MLLINIINYSNHIYHLNILYITANNIYIYLNMNTDRLGTIIRVLLNLYLFTTYGFIYMVIIQIVLSYIESFVFHYIFGLVQLSAVDHALRIEDPGNRMNVLA